MAQSGSQGSEKDRHIGSTSVAGRSLVGDRCGRLSTSATEQLRDQRLESAVTRATALPGQACRLHSDAEQRQHTVERVLASNLTWMPHGAVLITDEVSGCDLAATATHRRSRPLVRGLLRPAGREHRSAIPRGGATYVPAHLLPISPVYTAITGSAGLGAGVAGTVGAAIVATRFTALSKTDPGADDRADTPIAASATDLPPGQIGFFVQAQVPVAASQALLGNASHGVQTPPIQTPAVPSPQSPPAS